LFELLLWLAHLRPGQKTVIRVPVVMGRMMLQLVFRPADNILSVTIAEIAGCPHASLLILPIGKTAPQLAAGYRGKKSRKPSKYGLMR